METATTFLSIRVTPPQVNDHNRLSVKYRRSSGTWKFIEVNRAGETITLEDLHPHMTYIVVPTAHLPSGESVDGDVHSFDTKFEGSIQS